MDSNSRLFEDVLVLGAFVRVLKAPPAADVVDQDRYKVGNAAFHIVKKAGESRTARDVESALAVIRVGADDAHSSGLGILLYGVGLVLGRILLVLSGHSHILRNPNSCGHFHDGSDRDYATLLSSASGGSHRV